MKKLITLAILALLIVSMSACHTKTEDISSNPIPTTNENEKISYISTVEAIDCFKSDIHNYVPGYSLDYDGYLSGPEGGVGNIHTLDVTFEDYEHIYDFRDARYYINDNVIYKYQFSTLVDTYDFGSAIFCGHYYTGFVFRDGNEVKIVYEDAFQEEIVAKGVKMVITCDYRFSSDFTGILLLMEDNTLKVKISDDDELLDIVYEGGYQGTYMQGLYK